MYAGEVVETRADPRGDRCAAATPIRRPARLGPAPRPTSTCRSARSRARCRTSSIQPPDAASVRAARGPARPAARVVADARAAARPLRRAASAPRSEAMADALSTAAGALLEARDLTKRFGVGPPSRLAARRAALVHAVDKVELRHSPRRDARADRRERLRQERRSAAACCACTSRPRARCCSTAPTSTALGARP